MNLGHLRYCVNLHSTYSKTEVACDAIDSFVSISCPNELYLICTNSSRIPNQTEQNPAPEKGRRLSLNTRLLLSALLR
ncbi:hypothetical protein EG68_02555 [Paragonimus skrjabini miyazakii]|uniref:Uncharacterized protein n=1 Tax=Paragonimus skrjabini miyazakii TaxID=59628 RepID=A0A8S9Z3S4_9TREM|nr:hypothetical protein EG68_02555 [Paragonimus skrjabini miyazakii]